MRAICLIAHFSSIFFSLGLRGHTYSIKYVVLHTNMWNGRVGTCGHVPTYLAHVERSTCRPILPCGPSLGFACNYPIPYSILVG